MIIDFNKCVKVCKVCKRKRGLVLKSIFLTEFKSRCQVDLVDTQSQTDNSNKFKVVYQDHLTPFVKLC